MTDDELLDRITELLETSESAEAGNIRSLIRDHRQVGWKRRFLDSGEWMKRHSHQVDELTNSKFGKTKKRT